MQRAAAAALLAAALAGCGGHTAAAPRQAPCPLSAKARLHVARVPGDLARLRSASRQGRRSAVSHAADRFMLDVGYEPALRRNRLIDRAIALVVGVCHDCFLALEAMRPIPALAVKSPCAA